MRLSVRSGPLSCWRTPPRNASSARFGDADLRQIVPSAGHVAGSWASRQLRSRHHRLAQDCSRASPTACPPPPANRRRALASRPVRANRRRRASPAGQRPGDEPEPDTPGPGPNDPAWIRDNDPSIDCRIEDDNPITNDLWIVSIGEHILEIGTGIRWRFPSIGPARSSLLPEDIPAGEEKMLRNFLEDTEGGAGCRIAIHRLIWARRAAGVSADHFDLSPAW